jgi:hypothetical protein
MRHRQPPWSSCFPRFYALHSTACNRLQAASHVCMWTPPVPPTACVRRLCTVPLHRLLSTAVYRSMSPPVALCHTKVTCVAQHLWCVQFSTPCASSVARSLPSALFGDRRTRSPSMLISMYDRRPPPTGVSPHAHELPTTSLCTDVVPPTNLMRCRGMPCMRPLVVYTVVAGSGIHDQGAFSSIVGPNGVPRGAVSSLLGHGRRLGHHWE